MGIQIRHIYQNPYASHFIFRCESLADLIWQNRQQIKRVELLEMLRQQLPIELPCRPDDLRMLNQNITGLLSSLVTRYTSWMEYLFTLLGLHFPPHFNQKERNSNDHQNIEK